jgi:hypothetical protein
MSEVVAHKILEGYRLALVYPLPRDLIQIVPRPRAPQRVVRNARDNVGQVQIVRAPQLNQAMPGCNLISLHTNPSFLIVALKYKIVFPLRFHETAMIVGCRIDQMTKGLFCGPLVSRRTGLTLCFRDSIESPCSSFDGFSEFAQKRILFHPTPIPSKKGV